MKWLLVILLFYTWGYELLVNVIWETDFKLLLINLLGSL